MSAPTAIGESHKLTATTSGFVLAAAITILFNTALAWTKDAYAPLNSYMKALTGHHWTTHGIADLILFASLGLLFSTFKVGQKVSPRALVALLIGSVVLASLGLAVWYLVV